MSEALELLAFAAADGSEAGLALGDGRIALPPDAESRFAELEVASSDGPLAGAATADTSIVAGAVARPQKGESLRVAVAMFPEGRTLAVAALRPKRARGHDRDEIDALVVERGEALAVEDPRLSVTLDADALPLRVGLELWLLAPETDGDEPPPAEYPRRAAGEVGEPTLTLDADGLRTVAHPMRWRSRGELGVGWFLLAEPA